MSASRVLTELAEALDASRLVKPSGLREVDGGVIFYYRKSRAWAIDSQAQDEDAARRAGERVQRNLVGKKSLISSDPYLHHLTLYVAYPGGVVEIAGEPEKGRDTGKSDAKHKISYRGQSAFGKKGFALEGRDGDYKITIRPYLKEHRGKFAVSTFRAATLDEISAALDRVIEKLGIGVE